LLAEIDIANFAIIDRLHLTLVGGFNVLTGETGAGKSIVIDAVGTILGGKTSSEFVRGGAEQAHVEGIFALPSDGVGEELASVLAEHGLAPEDGTLILSRDVYRSGRTVARINGRAVPQSVLQQVGEALVDIHGQSEHMSLLRSAYQLDLLDEYAGLRGLRARLATEVTELRRLRRELERLISDERELARRSDLLRFQVNEIEAARLHAGEEDDLEHERTLLANAEKLAASADAAYRALYAGEGESPAAADRLGEATAALADLARLDPSLRAQAEAIENAAYQVEEVGRAMRNYRDNVEFNPARLQAVEERLDLIFTLKRKYGSSIEEILAYGRQAASELEALTHGEEHRAELLGREAQVLRQAGRLAAELSAARREASRSLSRAVEGELADLNMKRARFEVALEQVQAPDGVPLDEAPVSPRYVCDTTGVDRATFLISPNPGEPLKSLAKIASGGEMSRLSLALKTVLSRADRISTLIFDEVDVGVGGRSGSVVGEKLCGLAGGHQVICVTHLPQIACYADAHFRVVKEVGEARTATKVELLSAEGRVDELAAMLAGPKAGASARQSARELVDAAKQWKERTRTATGAGF